MTNQYSRSNRFEKKRKSTKLMTFLLGAGSLLLVAFIALFIFGGNGEDTTAKEPEPKEEQMVSDEEKVDEKSTEDASDPEGDAGVDESKDQSEDSESNEGNETQTTTDEEELEVEEEEQSSDDSTEEGLTVEEASDDENVKRVIKKNWEPVKTTQDIEGEHRVVYDTESQDWKEMETAIRRATGLTDENMITQYIGNGGSPNKAIATVYNRNDAKEIYRVNVQWIEDTGYQVKQIEELKNLPSGSEG
ncbi:YrrS family protein [Halobacillus litoralis]|uniref:YrrS family protein n=1 Tax=Halobacillus litoralis TaxID=45668 RepID=UPI001CD4EE36|nr:YrrS family protein [Halobacillus litoralis]MCA0969994.1 YrrS family protein [Halobacillus litoralis]